MVDGGIGERVVEGRGSPAQLAGASLESLNNGVAVEKSTLQMKGDEMVRRYDASNYGKHGGRGCWEETVEEGSKMDGGSAIVLKDVVGRAWWCTSRRWRSPKPCGELHPKKERDKNRERSRAKNRLRKAACDRATVVRMW